MSSFFDLDRRRSIPVAQYLSELESPANRLMVESLFGDAIRLIGVIRSDYTPRPDEPIIKVALDDSFYAAGMEGLIEISVGLINHCLSLPALPLERIVKTASSDAPLPTQIPNPLFSWTIAHEYWHGLRRHNLALENRDSPGHTKAAEIDADLCAAASVYRWAQQDMAANYCDSTIRQVVFAALFWAMRHLPNQTESDSHPEVLERIYHVHTKIIQLSSTKGLHVDPSIMTQESESHIPNLIHAVKNVDEIFRTQNPGSPSFIEFYLRFIEAKGWRAFTEPWDSLRTVVSLSSGTKA